MTAVRRNSAHGLALPEGTRVALVHDWLNGMRGGERVLEHFCALFPNATIHTLFAQPARLSPALRAMRIVESDFARLPGVARLYRHYLPLMPWFIGRMPTDHYNLVISTSHCVAKAAPRPRHGIHLSYVFSPMRYVWDHFHDYLSGNWWKDTGLGAMRPFLQKWDRRTAARADAIAADSNHIARKIHEFWGRRAETIYPPVDLDLFTPSGEPPDDYFLVVAALVPYKRIDRAVLAAREAGVRLVIVGTGPEEARLRAMAGPEVEFAGRVIDKDLPAYYRGARALLYPATEDFGITALESMACGRPVLAYRAGGATETVVEGLTGTFFDEPDPKALARLLVDHDDRAWSSEAIRRHAEQYSPNRFRDELVRWIMSETRFLW